MAMVLDPETQSPKSIQSKKRKKRIDFLVFAFFFCIRC